MPVKNLFLKTLQDQLKNTDEIDLRKVFPPAIDSINHLVQAKIEIINNASS